MTGPILDSAGVDALRDALLGYTTDTVRDLLGPVGHVALDRADLAGVARAVRGDRGRLATLVKLFLLGLDVDESDAERALAPLALARAGALVQVRSGTARALVDLRPYAEAGRADPWWVLSDFGADVRGGPLADDHVLGIGTASLTLAQATLRAPVARALDIGTGCGVQALHLSGHAAHVTATDISVRALRLAATTAALSGLSWDLRTGSLLDPVDGELFDLVVANPPFVVSAGEGGYDYRDSGLAGDAVCRRLVEGMPGVLAPGGVGQLLTNWVVPCDGDADERLAGWFAGSGCDAWVWRRETAEPAEYVRLWLRDAGEIPGTPRWVRLYDAWLDWFATAGVAAVGMGLVTIWRTDRADADVVIQDVPQPVEQPAGAHIGGWLERRLALRGLDDDALLNTVLRPARDLVRERSDLLLADTGWATRLTRLRQSYGMRWDVEVDDAVAAVVAGCDGIRPVRIPATVLAAALDEPVQAVCAAILPAVRELVARGVLEFADGSARR